MAHWGPQQRPWSPWSAPGEIPLDFCDKWCAKTRRQKSNFRGGGSKPPGEGLDEEIGSGLRVATLHHPLSASSEGGMVQRRPPRFARRPPPARWRNHRCEPVARSCRVRWPRRVGPGRGGAGMGFPKRVLGEPRVQNKMYFVCGESAPPKTNFSGGQQTLGTSKPYLRCE